MTLKSPPPKIILILLTAAALLTGFAFPVLSEDAETVTVFAAASTTNAVSDIGKLFAGKGKGQFRPSFASSSTLAKQIEQGAPADVYISANPKWMDYLADKHLIEPGSRFDLLGNRIVLIAPAGSAVSLEIGPGFPLAATLGGNRLAMGDPDHTPAGIYAKQALQSLGVWDAVSHSVARSKDVRAALALVERGETPLGVVYATDAAISDKIRVVGIFPEDAHPEITYPVAIVAGKASPAARNFLDFMNTPEARAVFEKYGFTVR